MRLMDLFLAWLVTGASKSFGLHDLFDTITIFCFILNINILGGQKKKNPKNNTFHCLGKVD